MSADQAQGLRRWAEAQGRGAEDGQEPHAMATDEARRSVEGDATDDRETAIARTLREMALAEAAETSKPRPATPAEEVTAGIVGEAADDRETAIARALVEIAREERALAASGRGEPVAAEGGVTAPPSSPAQGQPRDRVSPGGRPAARPRLQAQRRLRVLGLAADEPPRARRLLATWAGRGQRWVGRPDDWEVTPVALEAVSRHPASGYWALWVTPGPEAFRRGYRLLRALSRQPGPRRLLLLVPGLRSRRGLADNLAGVAEGLGIELLVITP
ncbi:hypothetical protein [Halomonas sp. 328]|uniref:hypothetical protein n=1 Tax=Halomonas sp. 328 TaxID=2776704 RepID=UPI0018A771A2|nr:hypothetical protein [Halomonas sp. 328]MBF8221185.1 hypothetical protein [Halomonas sp. 328]